MFTACSHAGVINVLEHTRASYPQEPIFAIMGGFHLAGPNEKLIRQTIEAMKPFNLRLIAAGHCTGWRAQSALTQAFGEAVMDPAVVGKFVGQRNIVDGRNVLDPVRWRRAGWRYRALGRP